MANLKGKTALVTGGARRIGRAVSLALAEAGVNVVVHYRSSGDEADEVARGIAATGVRSAAVKADLGDAAGTQELFEAALGLTGSIDILINSASIFDLISMSETTAEDLRRNFEINALAPFLLTRLLADHLSGRREQARARGEAGEEAHGAGGSVVNFLDSRITDYDRRHLPYAVSKRALHAITRMTALEYAPLVRVNAVAPGLILPPPDEGAEYLERLKTSNPLQSHGTLEQITESVMYLLTNDFVCGQILYVDGGRHMKGSVYGS